MASFLLATLYACNQEEEALKTLKPTDGGEVMVTASGTLTPAELLAQDSLMMAMFDILYPYLADSTSTLNTDSVFIADLANAKNNLYINYTGFLGLTLQEQDQLVFDALAIMIDGTSWPQNPPTATPYSAFTDCWKQAQAAKELHIGFGETAECACCQVHEKWNKKRCRDIKDDCGDGDANDVGQ